MQPRGCQAPDRVTLAPPRSARTAESTRPPRRGKHIPSLPEGRAVGAPRRVAGRAWTGAGAAGTLAAGRGEGREGAMTEAEWLACADPQPMLESLRGKGSDRKLYLFASACCRRARRLLNDPRSRRAVEAAELFADGLIGEEERWRAASEAEDAEGPDNPGWAGPYYVACDTFDAETAAYYARAGLSPGAPESGINAVRPDEPAVVAEARSQCDPLRDLFGNPFRPASSDPAWLTPDVIALALAAYDQRTLPSGTLGPARLALLADALEEAGCDNADLLAHLRGEGPHVGGCWAVDLAMGRG
jgi:hypothetical protein